MRTVLITGGSRGIGAEAVRLFANAGCRVVLNYNASEEAAKALAAEFAGRVLPVRADVACRTEVEAMFRRAEAVFGGVDVLICNAGVAQQKLFTDLTEGEWRRMLDVHLTGAFHCCQCALPHMIRQRWGRIVTVSSMWGQVGASCEAAYSATKGAVIALTKALAKELGPSGIRVNCVAPGVILTDMCANVAPDILAGMAEETPLGRNGAPTDVAKAIAYLADAEFITGQVLGVSGGYVI